MAPFGATADVAAGRSVRALCVPHLDDHGRPMVGEQSPRKARGPPLEKEVTDGALTQTKAEMSSLGTSVGTIKARSEELAAESTKLQEEKRKLMESLAVTQREAAEAAKKIMHLRASGGGGSKSRGSWSP